MESPHITVVIDVFRAATTAASALSQNPKAYFLATSTKAIEKIAQNHPNCLWIGKPEIGAIAHYDLYNSPTRVSEISLNDRVILHRTAAGAKGVIGAAHSDIILLAGFVNAFATIQLIQSFSHPHVEFVPMGHEGTTPSIEDDLCEKYLRNQLARTPFDISEYMGVLREGPGHYFFQEDQFQYPMEDFAFCLTIDRFNFAIQAEVKGEYAILSKRESHNVEEGHR